MTTSQGHSQHHGPDCCGPDTGTPWRYNRPGLPQINYRLGTQQQFLRRMLERLHSQTLPDGSRPLEGLASRSPTDDPALALLDAAATVADVLTFYQERIANEGYLGTATERRSVLELARAIGYELNPGVAASAHLAFTVADAPSMPRSVTVPQGAQVQSVPPQGKLPQTFETTDELAAHVNLNAFPPQRRQDHPFDRLTDELYLAGVSTNLQKGDAVLIVGEERESSTRSVQWDLRFVKAVGTDAEKDRTVVTLDAALGHESPDAKPARRNSRVYALRQRASLFGHSAPDWRALPPNVKEGFDPDVDEDDPTTWGHEWPNFEIQTLRPPRVDLDAEYPKVMNGSWVVLSRPGFAKLFGVKEVTTESRTDYTLTAKCTRIKLDTHRRLNWFGLRDTVVYVQSEELKLAGFPLTEPVHGSEIQLDAVIPQLEEGRPLIFAGKVPGKAVVADLSRTVRMGDTEERRPSPPLVLIADDGEERSLAPGDRLDALQRPETQADGRLLWRLRTSDGFEGALSLERGSPALLWEKPGKDADDASEVALIREVRHEEERTVITLESPLANLYDRVGLTIHGNVVEANHGETVPEEVLGSGDGSERNQRFKLKKSPLTFVSASTASGAESSLEVRINGVRWEPSTTLYGRDSSTETYMVRTNDDGSSTIIFGDGVNGARLPTGSENVTAHYRSGIGLEGEVEANSLSLLKTRPTGLQGVNNPVAVSGAADPERLTDARENAPMTVLTMDRVVSLRDFEDFARAFAGVSKAHAAGFWRRETQRVHLTVASTSGEAIPRTSALFRNLEAAIEGAKDPRHEFTMADHLQLTFDITARLLIDERYIADDVLEQANAALVEAFAFEHRDLGQPVTAAEVITVLQEVEGVMAVGLDALHLTNDPPAGGAPPASLLPAFDGGLDRFTGDVRPAELLVINGGGVTLLSMEDEE